MSFLLKSKTNIDKSHDFGYHCWSSKSLKLPIFCRPKYKENLFPSKYQNFHTKNKIFVIEAPCQTIEIIFRNVHLILAGFCYFLVLMLNNFIFEVW